MFAVQTYKKGELIDLVYQFSFRKSFQALFIVFASSLESSICVVSRF